MALPIMPTLGSCRQDDQEFDLILTWAIGDPVLKDKERVREREN